MSREYVGGAVMMTILAAVGTWMLGKYPMASWRCVSDDGGVNCVVTESVYGVVPIGRIDLVDIRTIEVAGFQGARKRTSPRWWSMPQSALRVNMASGPVQLRLRVSTLGATNYEVAEEVDRLLRGERDRYLARQFDWLPTVLGSSFAGVGPLCLTLVLLRRRLDRRQADRAGRQAARRAFFSKRRG